MSQQEHKTVVHSEPFVRLARRGADSMPLWKSLLIRVGAIVLAMLASALFIMLVTKLNPLDVYRSMFDGAFGTGPRTWITVRDMSLLLCLGVGLAPAFMMRFWNIGAEGQMLAGGLAAASCMVYFKDLPDWLLLIVMLVTSCLCGALWGLIPAFFKAKWGTNETLFTLMMNYIVLYIVEFTIDLWDKKQSHSVGIINLLTKKGWFPAIAGQQHLLTAIIVIAVTVLMFLYLRRSKHGYEIAVVGESHNTARYAGINVTKTIIRTMAISGAICGLAGFIEVAGVSHTLSAETAGGRGFTAIIVAWLAKFNTLTMIASALLITFLDRGAVQIASDFNLNEHASQIITGIILFFVLACEFFIQYRLIFRGKRKEAN